MLDQPLPVRHSGPSAKGVGGPFYREAVPFHPIHRANCCLCCWGGGLLRGQCGGGFRLSTARGHRVRPADVVLVKGRYAGSCLPSVFKGDFHSGL